MAYGIKYKTSYIRRSGNTTTITISENGYGGSVTTLIADANPLIITTSGNINNIYEPTLGSGAVINVLASPLSMINLFTTDPQKYKVIVYDGTTGGTITWQGFISTGVYNEDYSVGGTQLVPIQITCNDGMKILESIHYKNNGVLYSGNTQIGSLINTIVGKLGITFSNVYTSINYTLDGTNTNLFTGLSVNNENYIDESGVAMSCREVLNSVLGGLGLVMCFNGSNVNVIDPINLHTASTGKVYSLPSFVESSTTLGGYVDISGTTLGWYETGTNLDIVAQVNEVEVSYDPFNYTSIIYDFNKNISGAGSWSNPTGYFFNNGVMFKNWSQAESGHFIGVKETANDTPIYALYLNNSNTSITYTSNINLNSDDTIIVNLSFDSFLQTKEVSSNIYKSSSSLFPVNAYFLQCSIMVGNQYWKDDHWEAGTTGNYKQLLTVRDWEISEAQYVANKSSSIVNDVWETAKKSVPLSGTTGGSLTFIIYDYWTGTMVFPVTYLPKAYLLKNFNLQFVNQYGVIIENTGVLKTGNITNNTTYKSNNTKVELKNGTGIYGISRGSFLNTSNNSILGLYRSGDGTIHNTADLILQSIVSQYKQPRFKLSGVLDVSSFLYNIQNYLITDNKYLVGKSFYITSGTYNDGDESMNVEMLEITNTRETI